MTPLRLGTWYRVGEILWLFQQMGCILNTPEELVLDEDGDTIGIRYLLSPDRKSFADIVDLGDDDQVSAAEVEHWQDRLGVRIPLP